MRPPKGFDAAEASRDVGVDVCVVLPIRAAPIAFAGRNDSDQITDGTRLRLRERGRMKAADEEAELRLIKGAERPPGEADHKVVVSQTDGNFSQGGSRWPRWGDRPIQAVISIIKGGPPDGVYRQTKREHGVSYLAAFSVGVEYSAKWLLKLSGRDDAISPFVY